MLRHTSSSVHAEFIDLLKRIAIVHSCRFIRDLHLGIKTPEHNVSPIFFVQKIPSLKMALGHLKTFSTSQILSIMYISIAQVIFCAFYPLIW